MSLSIRFIRSVRPLTGIVKTAAIARPASTRLYSAHAKAGPAYEGDSIPKPKIHTFPPPKQQRVPTDLTDAQVKAVTECLNSRIADNFALYVKAKYYHWTVTGSHFRDYHLLLDEIANAAFGSIDVLAERIRRVGGTPIRSVAHIASLQRVPDDNSEGYKSAHEMLSTLVEDIRGMLERLRIAHDICDDAKDYATADRLEGMIDEKERELWFISSTLVGGNHTDYCSLNRVTFHILIVTSATMQRLCDG